MPPSIGIYQEDQQQQQQQQQQPNDESSITNSTTKQPNSSTPLPTATPPPTISIMPINAKKKICQRIRKIIILGESFVGKTSLVRRFSRTVEAEEEDHRVLQATLGTDFLTRVVVPASGHFLKLQLWDTAGEETFGLGLVPNAYLRQSHGVFLVYDVTDRQSFEKIGKWYKRVQDLYKNQEKQLAMVLVGNKSDVEVAKRQVTLEEGLALGRRFQVPFFECSAKDGLHVEQALTCMIQTIESPPPPAVPHCVPKGVPHCVPKSIVPHDETTTPCRQVRSRQLQLLPASFFLFLLCLIFMV